MIGDGSGYGWDIGAGWAGVVIDRRTMGRKLLFGGWSSGTIMISEFMPYIQGLAWYENCQAEATRLALGRAVLDVHVISDNKTIVDQGNNVIGRKKMLPWWACWGNYVRLGYRARFHFVPGHRAGRQLGLNVLCDHVSRHARCLLQNTTLADMLPESPEVTAYDVNP